MSNSKDKNGSPSRSGNGKDKNSKSRKKDNSANQASGMQNPSLNKKNGHSTSSEASQAKSKHGEDNSASHTNSRKRFICPNCGNSYANDDDLQEHIQDAHQPPRHSCDQCRQKFKRPAELDRHKVEAHSPRGTRLPKRDRESSGKRSLFSLGMSIGKPSEGSSSDVYRQDFMCPKCGLPFSRRERLQNHYRTVHER